jgi:hypothetical protein
LDKFESSVKQYADTKSTWRRKLSAKEGELEAAKVIMQFLYIFMHWSKYVSLIHDADNAIGPDFTIGRIKAAYAWRLE